MADVETSKLNCFFCWSHETETGNNPFCQWGRICSIFLRGKKLVCLQKGLWNDWRQRRLSTLVLALDQVEEMSHLGAKSFVTSWKLSQIRHEFWMPSRKPMSKMMKFWHALVWLFLIIAELAQGVSRKMGGAKWSEDIRFNHGGPSCRALRSEQMLVAYRHYWSSLFWKLLSKKSPTGPRVHGPLNLSI